jgi:hypothetical protein
MSHRALSPQQFNLAEGMGLHPSLGGSKVPDVITGRVARHVMHEADIRQTKRGVEAPHIATGGYQEGESEYSHPEGTVMTSQRHLHTPTLRRYATEGPPEHDPDRSYQPQAFMSRGGSMYVEPADTEPVPYHPEHYEHGGTRWLAEGHHRTVVHRLAR